MQVGFFANPHMLKQVPARVGFWAERALQGMDDDPWAGSICSVSQNVSLAAEVEPAFTASHGLLPLSG